jgi:hypothetical protein
MIRQLLSNLVHSLYWIGDRLKPKGMASKAIRYLPPSPIGEIKLGKHRGTMAYFWSYTDPGGKRHRKYLSRDKQLAEEKREELSGWLFQDGAN